MCFPDKYPPGSNVLTLKEARNHRLLHGEQALLRVSLSLPSHRSARPGRGQGGARRCPGEGRMSENAGKPSGVNFSRRKGQERPEALDVSSYLLRRACSGVFEDSWKLNVP